MKGLHEDFLLSPWNMGFNNSAMAYFFIFNHSTIGVRIVDDDDSILNCFRMSMA